MQRRILGVAALCALAAGSISGWWLFLSARFEAAAEQQVASWRAEGLSITYRGRATTGFPLRVALRYEAPSLSGAAGLVSFAWRGAEVVVGAPIWAPRAVQVDGSGMHRVDLAGLAGPLALTFYDASAALNPQPGGWTVEGAARALVVAGPGEAELARAPGARFRGEAAADHPLRASVELGRVELTDPGPFGAVLENVVLAAALSDVPSGSSAQALDAWRQSGGRLFLDRAALTWGPVALDARGVVGLDQELRPAGEIAATVRGYERAVDLLIASGRIPRENGPALKLLGRFMALGSGGESIELPLKLDGGWLYAGPAKLAPLAPLASRPR